MTDRYREQYRQPDDEFSKLFFTIWRTSGRGRIVDEEVEKQYRRILGNIPVSRLQACYDEYLETNETSGMPSPGRLKAIYNRRKAVRDDKLADKNRPRRPALSAKDKAWRKTQSQFAAKLLGEGFNVIPTAESPFDPSDVINAALLVDIGPEPPAMDTEAHRGYDRRRFEELRNVFEGEYAD